MGEEGGVVVNRGVVVNGGFCGESENVVVNGVVMVDGGGVVVNGRMLW